MVNQNITKELIDQKLAQKTFSQLLVQLIDRMYRVELIEDDGAHWLVPVPTL
jgi:hypothetical protein